MALTLEDKKTIVAEVAEVASKASSAVLADYCGLTVGDMTKLRSNARDGGVYLRVVRNTLARRAFKDTDFACLNDKLIGPMVIGFSYEEPSAAAKLFRDFSKQNEALTVTALSIGGKLLAAAELDAIASLPTYKEAVAQLASVMIAPITKFVRTLAEPHAKLVRTIAAIRDQKQAN